MVVPAPAAAKEFAPEILPEIVSVVPVVVVAVAPPARITGAARVWLPLTTLIPAVAMPLFRVMVSPAPPLTV